MDAFDSSTVASIAACAVAAVALLIAGAQVAQQYLSSGPLIRLCDSYVYGPMPGGGKRIWSLRQFRFRVIYDIPQIRLPADWWPDAIGSSPNTDISTRAGRLPWFPDASIGDSTNLKQLIQRQTSFKVSAYAHRYAHGFFSPLRSLSRLFTRRAAPSPEDLELPSLVPGNDIKAAEVEADENACEACWVALGRMAQLKCGLRLDYVMASGDADRCPADVQVVPMLVSLRDVVALCFMFGMTLVNFEPTRNLISLKGECGLLMSASHPLLGVVVRFVPRGSYTDIDQAYKTGGSYIRLWIHRMYGFHCIGGRVYSEFDLEKTQDAYYTRNQKALVHVPGPAYANSHYLQSASRRPKKDSRPKLGRKSQTEQDQIPSPVPDAQHGIDKTQNAGPQDLVTADTEVRTNEIPSTTIDTQPPPDQTGLDRVRSKPTTTTEAEIDSSSSDRANQTRTSQSRSARPNVFDYQRFDIEDAKFQSTSFRLEPLHPKDDTNSISTDSVIEIERHPSTFARRSVFDYQHFDLDDIELWTTAPGAMAPRAQLGLTVAHSDDNDDDSDWVDTDGESISLGSDSDSDKSVTRPLRGQRGIHSSREIEMDDNPHLRASKRSPSPSTTEQQTDESDARAELTEEYQQEADTSDISQGETSSDLSAEENDRGFDSNSLASQVAETQFVLFGATTPARQSNPDTSRIFLAGNSSESSSRRSSHGRSSSLSAAQNLEQRPVPFSPEKVSVETHGSTNDEHDDPKRKGSQNDRYSLHESSTRATDESDLDPALSIHTEDSLEVKSTTAQFGSDLSLSTEYDSSTAGSDDNQKERKSGTSREISTPTILLQSPAPEQIESTTQSQHQPVQSPGTMIAPKPIKSATASKLESLYSPANAQDGDASRPEKSVRIDKSLQTLRKSHRKTSSFSRTRELPPQSSLPPTSQSLTNKPEYGTPGQSYSQDPSLWPTASEQRFPMQPRLDPNSPAQPDQQYRPYDPYSAQAPGQLYPQLYPQPYPYASQLGQPYLQPYAQQYPYAYLPGQGFPQPYPQPYPYVPTPAAPAGPLYTPSFPITPYSAPAPAPAPGEPELQYHPYQSTAALPGQTQLHQQPQTRPQSDQYLSHPVPPTAQPVPSQSYDRPPDPRNKWKLLPLSWYHLSQTDVLPGFWVSPWTAKKSEVDTFCRRASTLVREALRLKAEAGTLLHVPWSFRTYQQAQRRMIEGDTTYPPFCHGHGVASPLAPESDEVKFSAFGDRELMPIYLLRHDRHDHKSHIRPPGGLNKLRNDQDICELMVLDWWLSRASRQDEIKDGKAKLIVNASEFVGRVLFDEEIYIRKMRWNSPADGLQELEEHARTVNGCITRFLELSQAEHLFLLVALYRTIRVTHCLFHGPDSSRATPILRQNPAVYLA